MPANDQKVTEVVLEEVIRTEERYPGYREVLAETLTRVIALEREHRVQRIDIQKRIGEICREAGNRLVNESATIVSSLDGK